MIAFLRVALMVSAARALPAASCRDRVALVARPRGVVHVAVAPLTETGLHVARGRRAVCGTRTGRLAVLARRAGGVDLGGRRPCVRCRTTLARRAPQVQGLLVDPVARSDWAAAFGNLSPANLAAAARTASTVAEVDQVGHLVEVLFGDVRRFHPRTPHEFEVAALRQLVINTRTRVTAAARTPDEVAQAAAARAAREHNDALILAARRKNEQIDRAAARRAAGSYETAWERELLDSA